MTATMTAIEPDVQEVLQRATFDGNLLFLPPEQLDPKHYKRVDTVLKSLGGKWNRSKKAHVFPDGTLAADAIKPALGSGEYVNPQDNGFYPTPPALAERVIDLAKIEPGMLVLEPSAGKGALAAPAAEIVGKDNVWCVEPLFWKDLTFEGYSVYAQTDFLGINPEAEDEPGYDRVIMNPPFGKKVELKHVLHAIKFLKPGGRLVAILPVGALQGKDKATLAFWDTLQDSGATNTFEVADGAFKPSGTNVRVFILLYDKKEDDSVKRQPVQDDWDQPVDDVPERDIADEDVIDVPVGQITEARVSRLPDTLRETITVAKTKVKQPEVDPDDLPLKSQVEIRQVPLDQITLDERLQPREMLSQTLVDEYTERLADGDEFPPVDVIEDGALLLLVDGWHRLAAHRQLARETIAAKVSPGGFERAILVSSGANAEHGLRRSNSDKRRAVIRLLTTESLAQLSDSALARAAKVSVRYVGMVRTTLENEGVIPEVTSRIGADGKVRDIREFQETIAPKLTQPSDPIKDEGSEFDNPDTPNADLLRDEPPAPTRAPADDDDFDALSLDESYALNAFDHVAGLLKFLDTDPALVLAMGQQHRYEQATLLRARLAEMLNWLGEVKG